MGAIGPFKWREVQMAELYYANMTSPDDGFQ